MQNLPVLYVIVPCYNEQEVLPITVVALLEELDHMMEWGTISEKSKILFVDDGSMDETWTLIRQMNRKNARVEGLKLSHNRGHQNALLAGLLSMQDRGDLFITIDADLQDDVQAMRRMVQSYREGYDVVYGVRNSRKTDHRFKRFSARAFYRLMAFMGVEIQYDHADYRLMSKRAVVALGKYREVNLFLRGLVPLLGFPHTTVGYDRAERAAGTSKYPLKKMVAFAVDGITSFSIRPIRFITGLGIGIFLGSVLMLIYSFVRYAQGHTVSGWSSLMVSIWALGGLQLLAIGIIGEYIGKIYLETKGRPRFQIEETLTEECANENTQ